MNATSKQINYLSFRIRSLWFWDDAVKALLPEYPDFYFNFAQRQHFDARLDKLSIGQADRVIKALGKNEDDDYLPGVQLLLDLIK